MRVRGKWWCVVRSGACACVGVYEAERTVAHCGSAVCAIAVDDQLAVFLPVSGEPHEVSLGESSSCGVGPDQVVPAERRAAGPTGARWMVQKGEFRGTTEGNPAQMPVVPQAILPADLAETHGTSGTGA